MTEHELLETMVAPGTRRPGKYRESVTQIHVTRACNLSCYGCTQGSNLRGKTTFLTPEQFEAAVKSLGFRSGDGALLAPPREPIRPEVYYGVVGVFGGNPALSPHFADYCQTLRRYVPYNQRGVWTNHPAEKGALMRETFDPAVSNVNVHLDAEAAAEFRRDWPAAHVVGEHRDSRHAPVHLAMKDLDCLPANPGKDERWLTKMPNTPENRHKLIADCDINRHWSAMIGLFRGQLRAWFCEVAGAQSILHQDEPDYPDTGLDPTKAYGEWEEIAVWKPGVTPRPPERPWWQLRMSSFTGQVRKHCHECAVPLRGYGELSQAPDHGGLPAAGESYEPREQTSASHAGIFLPKKVGRTVETVTQLTQLGVGRLERLTDYLGNGRK